MFVLRPSEKRGTHVAVLMLHHRCTFGHPVLCLKGEIMMTPLSSQGCDLFYSPSVKLLWPLAPFAFCACALSQHRSPYLSVLVSSR